MPTDSAPFRLVPLSGCVGKRYDDTATVALLPIIALFPFVAGRRVLGPWLPLLLRMPRPALNRRYARYDINHDPFPPALDIDHLPKYLKKIGLNSDPRHAARIT
jgi:hypothetical protein